MPKSFVFFGLLIYSPLPLSVTVLCCWEISKDRKYFCCVILLTICLFPSPNTILDLLSTSPHLGSITTQKLSLLFWELKIFLMQRMCYWCLICWELRCLIKTTKIRISLIKIWVAVSKAIAAATSYAIDFELINYKWPVNHPLIIDHKLTPMPYFQLIGFKWKLQKTI